MSKLVVSKSIPASWNFIPLKELGDWSGGGTPSKAKLQYWQGGTIPWVSPKDMKTQRIADSEDHITMEAVSHSTASLINAGSILIVTRSGILRHTLPVAVNSVLVTVNQDLKILTPRNGIMAEYVAWALRAFSHDILHICSKQGTTVNSVETSKLLDFEIPVAPRGQQAKIVAEIEKQFSRLDEAVANLKRVKANLKRYKAAVEGKLTEDWRKQHPDVEPASKLLEHILTERKAKFGQKKDSFLTAEGDPPALSPDGWAICSIDQIAECPDAKRVPVNKAERAKRGANIPYYGANGQVGVIDDYIFDEPLVLVVEDETFTGRTQSFSYMIRGKSWVNNHAHVLRSTAAVTASYLNYSLAYYPFIPRTTGSTGRRKLTQRGLMTAPFLLPPLVEQEQIVVEVERRLSVMEELEAAVEANLTRADRLRQSILGSAFSGRLFIRKAFDLNQGGSHCVL